jgi:uncharacterized protein YkwD
MKLICCGWIVVLACSVQPANNAGLELSASEKKLLELTNAERKKKDLAPLRTSPLLFKAARGHASNMAKQGKLEHVLDGKNPLDRARDVGYKFESVGENVAWLSGSVNVEALMKMWMESQIHRDNILNPEVTEIGLGLASDGNDHVYYVQVFGKSR